MANVPLQAYLRIVTTVGETLSDGSFLELVASATPGRLALLFRRAGDKKIAAQIEHSGCLYRPPNLDDQSCERCASRMTLNPMARLGNFFTVSERFSNCTPACPNRNPL